MFANTLKSSLLTFFVLAGALFAPGLVNAQDLDRIFAEARAAKGKRPIIIIPGILGSELVNPETNEVVWPSLRRSDKDGLTLPLAPRLRESRDSLVARQVLGTIKTPFFVPEIKVYQDLLVALQKYGGFREGNWDAPGPDDFRDTFYVFPYDWRRDNVETAQLLIRRIATLKAKLNRPDLRFNIVAHSMGGLISRYAARYGDADLPEEGRLPASNWAGASHINKIFMFGTPNQGAASILRVMLKGYLSDDGLSKLVSSVTNKLTREDALTIPSLYQLLPHSSSVSFLDENLQPLDLDLYNTAVWRKYGWTPAGDEKYRADFQAGKLEGDCAPCPKGKPEELDAFLALVLRRAKRFHEALDAPTSGEIRVPLYVYGGDCLETLVAPVLVFDDKKQRWTTLTRSQEIKTSAGRKISSKEVDKAMFAPGDGRVSRRSLLGEDLIGIRRSALLATALPINYAVFSCSEHGELPNNKVLQNNALTALTSEIMQ
jgi:pimeloyl-ACP methyl ester carboxylesterase